MFDSGVSACRRIGAARSLAALAVTALVAGSGLLSTTTASRASADDGSTAQAQTQGTSDAHLASQRTGSHEPGDQLTPRCSARDAGVRGVLAIVPASHDTRTLEVASSQCISAPSATDGQAESFVDASRTTGRTQGANPGAPGQCTWGAAQKWFEDSGSYPALVGDATSWGDAATAAGWTVADDARDRSIVVFKPGVAGAGSIGHVAWVDSVSDTSDGQWIHVTEMNNSYLGGAGIFNERDVRDVPGMSYILLP
jgi:surface antigen